MTSANNTTTITDETSIASETKAISDVIVSDSRLSSLKGSADIHTLIVRNNIDNIKEMSDLEKRSCNITDAFSYACSNNYIEVVEFILENQNKFNIDITKDYLLPLRMATNKDNKAIVLMLLQSKKVVHFLMKNMNSIYCYDLLLNILFKNVDNSASILTSFACSFGKEKEYLHNAVIEDNIKGHYKKYCDKIIDSLDFLPKVVVTYEIIPFITGYLYD